MAMLNNQRVPLKKQSSPSRTCQERVKNVSRTCQERLYTYIYIYWYIVETYSCTVHSSISKSDQWNAVETMSHFKEICFSNFTNITNETLQIGKFEALHPPSLVACTHKESQWQSKIQQLGVVPMNHPKYTYTCWFHSHVLRFNH